MRMLLPLSGRASDSARLATLLLAVAAWTHPAAAGAAVPDVAVAEVARPTGGQAPARELLVLGAASLADVLPRVAAAWEARGGEPVRFSFAATSRLAPQALEAGRADLFIGANERWTAWLGERGGIVAGSVRTMAGNELVLIVPRTSEPVAPDALSGLRRVALAGESVPAGEYARQALESLGLWADVEPRVIRAGSVRGALEWVARGEADAGVVYRTDAVAETGVAVTWAFPAETHAPVRYTAAVLASSRQPERAGAFLEFAVGPDAAEIFRQAGFAPPPPAGPGLLPEPAPAPPPDPWSAVRLSLVVALLATAVGLVPAIAFGWLLARRDFRGKAAVSTLLLSPLVLPPVVTGFLLLSLLGTGSPVGRFLEGLGLGVPFTLVGAAVAAFVVGFPLYVLSVRGAFEAVDPHYEEVSWTLGVPRWRTFLRVSLPLAIPGISAGAVLAFARALGEFGATVVLAGNVEGSTRTIALAVYTLLESPGGGDPTWILVGASVVLALLALLGYEALSRRQRRRLEDRRA